MKIMIVHISTFVVFLTIVHRNNGGCDVNDWPRSCLANFRIGKQRCEPCESGLYGCNCSKSCPDNTYGPGCYTLCDCPEGVLCDPMVGCVNGTHTSKGASYNHSARQTTATVYHTDTTKDNTGTNEMNYLQQSHEHDPLNNFAMSLLVSVGTVVFFGAICAFILIRISKRFYKREYRKLLNHWQSSDLTTGDSNVYSLYAYTDSLLTSISSRSNQDCAMYDHSSEATAYNILSLRNMSIKGNGGYDADTCRSIMTPQREKSSPKTDTKDREKRESDFDLEPECFLNLFDENQSVTVKKHLYDKEEVLYESVRKITTKL